MNTLLLTLRRILPVLLCLLCLGTVFAEPSNYPTFTSVLGQPDFTSNDKPDPPTSMSLRNPEGIAVDPTTGKFFVGDRLNHRVLRYTSVDAYRTGAAAEAVLGQAGFDQNGFGLSATRLNEPTDIFVDSAGRLWVSDRKNKRVVRFDNASTVDTGAPANGVIGQPDLDTTGAAGPLPHSKFDDPTGLFVTPDGALWIADEGLDRILRFDNAASLNGVVTADQVIGQPDLATSVEDVTRTNLNDPWGIWIDAAGNLYVGDASNHRVLRFDDAANAGNGPQASAVFGQPDFVSDPKGTDSRSFHSPYYVAVSPGGTLWVGDYTNNRFLGFRNAASLASNPEADIVVGQPDFDTGTERPASNQDLTSANSIAFGESGSIFFCDYSGSRILRYSDPVELNAPRKKSTRRPRVTLRGTSSGAELVQYRVKGQGGYKRAKGNPARWKARIKKLSRRTTPVITRAWAFDNRSAGDKTRIIYRQR